MFVWWYVRVLVSVSLCPLCFCLRIQNQSIDRSIGSWPLSEQLHVVVHELFTPPAHQQTDSVISGFNRSWSGDNRSMQREHERFLWRHKTSITPHNICSDGLLKNLLQTDCWSNSSCVSVDSSVVNKVWWRGEALLTWRLITWQQLFTACLCVLWRIDIHLCCLVYVFKSLPSTAAHSLLLPPIHYQN